MALRYIPRILLAIAASPFVFPGGAAAPPEASSSVIFVLGPSAGDRGLQAARSVNFACQRWLKQPGTNAELRRAGSSEHVALTAKAPITVFLKAARDAGDREPADLISTLDDAVHALADRPGTRVAVAVLDAVLLSSDAEESLRQIIQYSADNSVHLVLLDPSKSSPETSGEIWRLAGSTTSGAFIQESTTLASTLLTVSGVQPTAADAEPASKTVAAKGPAKLLTNRPATLVATRSLLSGGPSALAADVPVHVSFFQISSRAITTQDGNAPGADAGSPLHGYVIVQEPLSALHFDKDEQGGSYSAHAVVTANVHGPSGKVVWHATKDMKITGALAKFHERDQGSLYLVREVMLPGGSSALEASVQDVLATKTTNVSAPLTTNSGVPGLMVSGAMFVRSLRGNADKFDSDTVLNYQGNAFAPILDPVFPANTPFKVELYFILYPDLFGTQPEISLDVLQEGRVVSQTTMTFQTPLRNNGQEISNSPAKADHGFDYIVSLNVDKMSASSCQARLTVRQGKKAVTRLVDFVVGGSGTAAPGSTVLKTSN